MDDIQFGFTCALQCARRAWIQNAIAARQSRRGLRADLAVTINHFILQIEQHKADFIGNSLIKVYTVYNSANHILLETMAMKIQPVEAPSPLSTCYPADRAGDLQRGPRTRSKVSELGSRQQLGVSRGPLREALRRLEGRKLIERKTNFGASVAKLSVDDLDNLLGIREALEGMAARPPPKT